MVHPVTQEILQVFKKHGHIVYGEDCTVLAHSVQAGLLARDKGLDRSLILAAFLHDIGHLCPLESEHISFERMGDYGIEAHDHLGAGYLTACGFKERLIAPVKNHVASKRYLCFAEPGYYAQLSAASRETLAYQGGPMEEVEAWQFESAPFFEESLLIRRMDEEAKAIDFVVETNHWNYFGRLIDQELLRD